MCNKDFRGDVHGIFQQAFQKIVSRLGIDKDQLKRAIAKIVRLNPSPGGQLDDSYSDQAQQIVPDFVLVIENGELSFKMPRFRIPEIRVNSKYANSSIPPKGAATKRKKRRQAL